MHPQALLLTLGRLSALLEGDTAFVQMAVPLLMTERAAGAPMQLHACAAHVLAAVAGFCGRSNNLFAPFLHPSIDARFPVSAWGQASLSFCDIERGCIAHMRYAPDGPI